MRILADRGQRSVGTTQVIIQRVNDLAVFNDGGPGPVTADPKISLAILEETENPAAVQSRSVVFIEDFGMHAVEPHQTVEGAKPKIAIACLGDCDDFIVWQPFFGPPMID